MYYVLISSVLVICLQIMYITRNTDTFVHRHRFVSLSGKRLKIPNGEHRSRLQNDKGAESVVNISVF